MILIEDQQSVQKSLMNIIADLSIIRQGEFGIKCLNTLNDLMGSGSEMKEVVKDILKNKVVSHICKNYLNDVPQSVIHGLIKITLENDVSTIFVEETIKFMSHWIKEV